MLVMTPPQEMPITPTLVASTSGRERRSEFASIVSASAWYIHCSLSGSFVSANVPSRAGPEKAWRAQVERPFSLLVLTSVWPSTAMLMAAKPWAFHFWTHSLKAVPPPPWTSTMAGTLPSRFAGSPIHAKTRVGFPP